MPELAAKEVDEMKLAVWLSLLVFVVGWPQPVCTEPGVFVRSRLAGRWMAGNDGQSAD